MKLFLISFFSILPIFATPTCSDYSFTSQNHLEVLYSTHGYSGDTLYRVKVSGILLTTDDYIVYKSTGKDIWLGMSSTFTGVFTICGSYTLSSASTDFQPTSNIDSGTGLPEIVVCAYCTSTNYAYRTGWGAMSRTIKLRKGGSGNAYIRVYLLGGRLYMATSNGDGGSCVSNLQGDCSVATYVTDFPANSKQIAYGYAIWTGSAWTWNFLNDLRSF